MYLSTSLLVSWILLAASCTSSALAYPDGKRSPRFKLAASSPPAPRSAQNDRSAQQAIRRRQTTAQQVARRMKERPLRKRQGASPGLNQVVNPGFQTSSAPPWVLYSSTTDANLVVYSGIGRLQTGETTAYALALSLDYGPGVMSASQSLLPTAGMQYKLTYDLGSDNYRNPCDLAITLGSQTLVSTNAFAPCPQGTSTPSGCVTASGYFYPTTPASVIFTADVQVGGAARPHAFQLTCTTTASQQNHYYALDNVLLVALA